MKQIKIIIGSDHRGYDLKEFIKETLFERAVFVDVGSDNKKRSDYPLFSQKVLKEMAADSDAKGILICGSGIGMSIAANRQRGIYAGLCWNLDIARVAYKHDRINILVLPSDFVSLNEGTTIALELIKDWGNPITDFDRYRKRLEMIDEG